MRGVAIGAGDVHLGLQGAVDTGARREGLDQAERQAREVEREVARRRIDRAADAAAGPPPSRNDAGSIATCAPGHLHMGRRRERQRDALVARVELLKRDRDLVVLRLDLGGEACVGARRRCACSVRSIAARSPFTVAFTPPISATPLRPIGLDRGIDDRRAQRIGRRRRRPADARRRWCRCAARRRAASTFTLPAASGSVAIWRSMPPASGVPSSGARSSSLAIRRCAAAGGAGRRDGEILDVDRRTRPAALHARARGCCRPACGRSGRRGSAAGWRDRPWP